MGPQDERQTAAASTRPEHAVIDRIQRLVDELGAALGLPVSVDDHNFRLQFYSPQLGTVDRVRVESILFRDSPLEAKQWVRDHGVTKAQGPSRVPPSEDLGLLPRICVPIPHDDALLGYLWIIDADEVIGPAGLRRARECADAIGPLMFRRLFLERLDRASERAAITQLIDDRADVRQQGLTALSASQGTGILPVRILVIQVRRDTEGQSANNDIALALEVTLEAARGDFRPRLLHLLLSETGAAVLLSHAAAVAALEPDGAASTLRARIVERLGTDTVVVGAGRLARQSDAIRDSFEDARDAAEIELRGAHPRTIVDARWLGPHRHMLRTSGESLAEIADDTLGTVLAPRHQLLLETLEVFLQLGGDVALVARTLGLHRSSVYARMARLQELLAVDLADGEARFALHYAIVARHLADRPGSPHTRGPHPQEQEKRS